MRAALAKASLVARASPTSVSKARLPGRSGQTCGAPGFERGDRADHMRQRLPVDLDRLGRILCRIERVGDHEGDRIADMAHHVLARGSDSGGTLISTSGTTPGVGKGPSADNIVRGQHQAHARHARARAQDRSMRKRAWACGERTTTACSGFAGATSAT